MEATPKEVRLYQDTDGRIPFKKWFEKLRDTRGQQKILARIDRARLGNFGDHQGVGEGVAELRIHYGPGYRVYFGVEGQSIVILLIGGDKSTQENDIKEAKKYWKEYQKEQKYADG